MHQEMLNNPLTYIPGIPSNSWQFERTTSNVTSNEHMTTLNCAILSCGKLFKIYHNSYFPKPKKK